MRAEPAQITRLVVEGNGSSRFVDDEMPMTPRDVAPPAAPIEVTDPVAASGAIFWRVPSGWDGQQHPAPTRQWVVVFDGALEVEASDGECRRFGPGDTLLLEDVTGDGHTTRVVGDSGATGMFVRAPAPDRGES